MKVFQVLAASAMLVGQVLAAPATDKVDCPNSSDAVPLLRAYHTVATDHFYTTSSAELSKAAGYVQEGQTGRLFSSQVSQTTPLFHLYNSSKRDHFYTIKPEERDTYVKHNGYTSEAATGYVFALPVCGSVPLHMMFHRGATDHLYTTDEGETKDAKMLGYTYEGIAGYILPA